MRLRTAADRRRRYPRENRDNRAAALEGDRFAEHATADIRSQRGACDQIDPPFCQCGQRFFQREEFGKTERARELHEHIEIARRARLAARN